MTKPTYLVVAVDQDFGIGINNTLPWKLKDDMRFFQQTTSETKDPDKQNLVIMGRKTWESIPENHRPLPNRKNVILTRNPDYQVEGAEIFHSLEEALNQDWKDIETIFIIGGAQIFAESMKLPNLTGIYLTQIFKTYDCDTYFPELPDDFMEYEKLGEVEEGGVAYEYRLYTKSS